MATVGWPLWNEILRVGRLSAPVGAGQEVSWIAAVKSARTRSRGSKTPAEAVTKASDGSCCAQGEFIATSFVPGVRPSKYGGQSPFRSLFRAVGCLECRQHRQGAPWCAMAAVRCAAARLFRLCGSHSVSGACGQAAGSSSGLTAAPHAALLPHAGSASEARYCDEGHGPHGQPWTGAKQRGGVG